MIVTADHGNLEMMRDPATGEPHTAHTVGPVPLVYFGARRARLRDGGALRDIAPTLLAPARPAGAGGDDRPTAGGVALSAGDCCWSACCCLAQRAGAAPRQPAPARAEGGRARKQLAAARARGSRRWPTSRSGSKASAGDAGKALREADGKVAATRSARCTTPTPQIAAQEAEHSSAAGSAGSNSRAACRGSAPSWRRWCARPTRSAGTSELQAAARAGPHQRPGARAGLPPLLPARPRSDASPASTPNCAAGRRSPSRSTQRKLELVARANASSAELAGAGDAAQRARPLVAALDAQLPRPQARA